MTTVTPNNTLNINPVTPSEQDVKVTNTKATAGAFSLQSPNVPAVSYTIGANSSRNFQIPIGLTVFTNTGTVNLDVTN
jgi:hypothetical protein